MKISDIDTSELSQVAALQYSGSGAPVLSAKGQGELAEAILAIAHENDIPLCENAALVDLLTQLELGEQIPEELYTTVAWILAYAYELVFDKEDGNTLFF